MKSLETISERYVESLLQHIASSFGFDACKIQARPWLKNNLTAFDMCFAKTDSLTKSFLFKEDFKTGKLADLYVVVSQLSAPTFKMFLSEILRCSADGWHIKLACEERKMILPAFSSLENLLVLSDLNNVDA